MITIVTMTFTIISIIAIVTIDTLVFNLMWFFGTLSLLENCHSEYDCCNELVSVVNLMFLVIVTTCITMGIAVGRRRLVGDRVSRSPGSGSDRTWNSNP